MHVYAHLFDGQVGQLPRPVTALRAATRLTRPAYLPQLYPYGVAFSTFAACTGTISWSTDHTHRIPEFVVATGMGPASIPPAGTVTIPRADVDAGVARTYRTTVDNGHAHTLFLTAADMRALRAGQALSKQTSRDARPGGRQHAHAVAVRCAL